MNIKYLIAAATMLVSGAVLADSTYPYVDHSRFAGTRDRADVQAELAASSPISSRLNEFVDTTHVASGKSRADIRAELDRAHAEGSHASNRMSEFTDFSRPAGSGRAATSLAGLGQGASPAR
nr:hypothetical protein [uncultured Noviherbaspirillum sp.]